MSTKIVTEITPPSLAMQIQAPLTLENHEAICSYGKFHLETKGRVPLPSFVTQGKLYILKYKRQKKKAQQMAGQCLIGSFII